MQYESLGALRAERTGGQWVKAVICYLEWRAGLPWISYVRFRFHPEVENYVCAIREVNFAWNEPEPKKLPQAHKRAA